MEVKKKKCPECGKVFECLHNKDCWCVGLHLAKETLEFLKKTYPDCLCRDCILRFTDIKH